MTVSPNTIIRHLVPLVASSAALFGSGQALAASSQAIARSVAANVALASAPSHATRAAGGCSVASAPVIASGATQTSDPNACSDGNEYWAIKLKIGDTLTVNIASSSPFATFDFAVYGPSVGTLGTPLCDGSADPSSSTQLSCLIGAAGTYVLVTQATLNQGSFTSVVKSVLDQAGRVAGECDPANAPTAPARITQYANTGLCASSGSSQYWKIDLRRGDTLTVNIASSSPSEAYEFAVYGPNVGTIGTPLCQDNTTSSKRVSCRVRAAGTYLLGAGGGYQNQGSFTPLVIHPTLPVLNATHTVKAGGAITISVTIRSNTPQPTGTCLVDEASGAAWLPVARAHTATGVCSLRLVVTPPGTVRLRVRFGGSPGWASSSSKPITVVVR
jgi:hypothetical protein